MHTDVIALTRNPEFLRLGLMLSLERRPDEPAARALFHDIRRQTHAQLELTFRRLLDENDATADPHLARQLATISMAAADGLFIAHQIAPDDIDIDTTFELLLTALLDRVVPVESRGRDAHTAGAAERAQ